jgi:SsrA-binding protein
VEQACDAENSNRKKSQRPGRRVVGDRKFRRRRMGKESVRLIANNKKAYHDYFIDETYETGIALAGTEVKSLRMGKCSIKEAYISMVNGEALIYGMNISPYEKGNIFNKDPLRPRKLLLHRQELNKLWGAIQQKGFTIVPLKVYLKGSLVKVEIGVARGKKQYDKRADIAKKDAKRSMERAFKEYNR